MSWELSHSDEGIENARKNTFKLEKEEVSVIYAEIKANTPEAGKRWNPRDFNEAVYGAALEEAKIRSKEFLCEYVFEYATQINRTTDKGGFNLWLCPFGCHKVSFDCPAE